MIAITMEPGEIPRLSMRISLELGATLVAPIKANGKYKLNEFFFLNVFGRILWLLYLTILYLL